MLKWKFFPIVPITLPTQTWRRKFLEDCSRSTLWQKPANACTWWVGFLHGDSPGEICAWFVGFSRFACQYLTFHSLFSSQVHMLLLPFLPITALIIQVGFLLIKFPHLDVASHNQNLVPTQNVTELNNLERTSAISDWGSAYRGEGNNWKSGRQKLIRRLNPQCYWYERALLTCCSICTFPLFFSRTRRIRAVHHEYVMLCHM